MACSAAGLLWAGRLSRMTMSPSCSVGTSWVRTWVSKIARSIGASMTHGAVMALERSPATKVRVFQWPKGALEQRRSPLSQRPRPGHLRVGSRFVDEDQPVRLGPHLGLSLSLPRLARLAHVGPIAFARLKAFF